MDTTLLAGIMGLVGALIGGAIGGFGSYYGGIKGAKANLEIQAELNKKNAMKRMSIQLILTSELVAELMEREDIPLEALDYMVYDKSWVDQICYLDDLSSDELGEIITWYHILESLAMVNKSGRQMTKDTFYRMVGHKAKRIHEIAKKIAESKVFFS